MNIKSKKDIRDIIEKDMLAIHDRCEEMSKRRKEIIDSGLAYFQDLAAQLSQPSSGPYVAKTPKLLRKKAVQRIETIPENEIFETTSQRSSTSSFQSAVGEEHDQNNRTAGGRAKRSASKKAAENIYKQSLLQNSTLHKQPDNENNAPSTKGKRETRAKRKKSLSSDDENDDDRSAKYSKLEDEAEKRGTRESTRRATKKKSEQLSRFIEKTKIIESKEDIAVEKKKDSFALPKRNLRRSKTFQDDEVNKSNDEIVAPTSDMFEDASVYEDAIGKPVPIMNSTMRHSFTKNDKVMNATVLVERISHEENKGRKLNETVVLKKQSSKRSIAKNSQEKRDSTKYAGSYNGLITDDESPEMKKTKQERMKETRRAAATAAGEDETPTKTYLRSASAKDSKAGYKSNALFSPYAEESVRKRVKAFEEAVMSGPANPVAVDTPTRMTRTKTRAMTAAVANETEAKNADAKNTVAQILARKSIAKAKRISLAKQKKDSEESKENKEMPVRLNKLIPNDKTGSKQTQQQQQQQKTPLLKMNLPSSMNRIHTPLNTQNLLNHSKALTVSRTNIITNVESFIQPKSMTKTNSAEQLDEEKKKRSEEDARKKKGEALRLLTEERKKKREEKELKNRLAREAKEKQELERRQKAEREREEKAKLALMMQEKQREEMERKRLAQLQRAQEKEERRRKEEQQRLQRIQEQEEAERALAEQRRREQEAEKRREAELRAQNQAITEALRQKNLMLMAQTTKLKQQQAANSKAGGSVKNYKLDSEPDDEESDDESRPKYEVPYWAQPNVRKKQLAMQQHISQELIFRYFGTRECTPDLTEIFKGIDTNRLKRTSSAIWKTPPRSSMMGRIE